MTNKPVKRLWPLLFGLAALLMLAPESGAQPVHTFATPLRSSGTLPFYLDACQFAAADGRTRLELPYAILLQPAGAGDSTRLQIDLEVSHASGILAAWHEQRRLQAPAESLFTFLDLKRCELAADTVALRMSVRETGGDREGRIEARLPVRDFGESLSVSDPFFIRSIHRPEAKSDPTFLRSGLLMVPDPQRIFDGSAAPAKATLYLEINHLDAAAATDSNRYTLRFTLADLAGHVLHSEERKDLPVVQANTARVEQIDLRGIPAGSVRLELTVAEQRSGATATTSRCLTVRGSETEAALLPMAREDQERYLEQLRFIASRDEIALFKRLDERGKQEFLLRFWQAKDPTPETPENEFMTSYFSRLAEARSRFKGGLQSDMARIYLRYGAPLEIERNPSSTRHNKPVEVWTYGLNGRTQFVFVDRNNDGHWVLVHSNHPDEFSNSGWEKDIQ